MPLGKMSKAQILQAYSILSETSKLLEDGPKKENFKKQLVDVTNRFFTLVPHSFGTADPPLLDSLDLVKVCPLFYVHLVKQYQNWNPFLEKKCLPRV